MIEASPPSNEEARLAALRSYDILDTPAEEAFDDLTRVAARVCGTPIALVSLIDTERQWFKSKVGLQVSETPREFAFCSHAILDPEETMVVEDATRDPRFSDNPLVTGDPHVLFYAGAPLVNPQGLPLGTLCVIDSKPRTIDEESLDTLRSLACAAVTQLELRKTGKNWQESAHNLAIANQELEKRNEEVRRFYHALSHELKTPLTVAREYVSMVLDGLAGEIGSEQRHFLSMGVENCDRLGRCVDDLLDLRLLETCKFHLDQRTVRVGEILKSVAQGMTPVAERAALLLINRADDDLPELHADPDRIIQVVSNLIRNAIQRTPEGGRIWITARRAPDRSDFVELAVNDSGQGIPQEDLARVFDRTYEHRGKNGTLTPSLGLHLAREVIRLHDGDIAVESEEGRGTTFRFRLPTQKPSRSETNSEVTQELTSGRQT